jgi:hypothetical protein
VHKPVKQIKISTRNDYQGFILNKKNMIYLSLVAFSIALINSISNFCKSKNTIGFLWGIIALENIADILREIK